MNLQVKDLMLVLMCYVASCAIGVAVINDSLHELRVEIVKSRARTIQAITESRARTIQAITESRANTIQAITESRANTIQAIGELRGELGVLNTRVDSLEGKVEGVIEHLRNRDAQASPKDTSTLDLEETSP